MKGESRGMAWAGTGWDSEVLKFRGNPTVQLPRKFHEIAAKCTLLNCLKTFILSNFEKVHFHNSKINSLWFIFKDM